MIPSSAVPRPRCRRYSFWVFLFSTVVLISGCKKPRERHQVDPHLAKAFELAETDPDGALRELGLARHATPAESAFVRARALEGRGDRKQALLEYEKAVELNPRAPQGHVGLGRLLLVKGDLGAAREHLTTALRLAPDTLEAGLLLALAARTEQERLVARTALHTWESSRSAKSKKDVPLRSEYHLVLASVSSEPQQIEDNLRESRISDVGSVEATLALAELAELLQKKSLALDLTRRLARTGTSSENYSRMAALAVRLGDLGLTSEILRHIPQNVRSPELLMTKARLALGSHHAERALTHARAARQETSAATPRVLDELDCLEARIMATRGQRDEATRLLRAVLKRSPTHREAHSLLSELQIRSGQATVASERLQKLVGEYPHDVPLLLELGRAQLAARKWPEARRSFEQVAQRTDGELVAYQGISQSYLQEGKETESLELWESAQKKYPERLPLLRELASGLVRARRSDDAIRVVRDSSLGEKDPVGVGLLLADTHDSLGQASDVERVLSELVKTHPRNARAWSAWARQQGRKKDFTGMEASLKMVLQLDPRALRDKARLAVVLHKQKRYAEAAQVFEALAQETGTDVVALNNTAMLYIDELDDSERALVFAEKAHRLAPDLAPVTDTLAWALSHSTKSEDLARARALFQKIDAAQGSAEARYHFGALLIRLGEKKDGIALVRSALSVPGEHSWKDDALALL